MELPAVDIGIYIKVTYNNEATEVAMRNRRRKKIDWNARIDWFDDWREWFGPKTYGIGWTAKSWKGAVATGLVVCLIGLGSILASYYLR